MFEALTDKLNQIFRRLRSRGKLLETDVVEALREVRIALLEADVSLKAVKEFVARVKEKAIGKEVLESLTPGQAVIKIVHDEMVELLGPSQAKLAVAPAPPSIYMLVGLQGSGKTTTTGKLASHLKEQGKNPLLVASDVQRPAAIKQLQVLGDQLGIPVFSMGEKVSPLQICKGALQHALFNGRDCVIIDTAGRLHIADDLMQELAEIKENIKPHDTLLVVDAMTGQDAVAIAQQFSDRIGIDGVILTKLDGDARGGAALSVKAVTGKPIKFVGTGEKLAALELFYPDRMASRILGMGDILSLVEKVEASVSEQKALELERKLREQDFGLGDFLDQLREVRKIGPVDQLLSMIPGLSQARQLKGISVDERQLGRTEAIICSMTIKERNNPVLINAGRRRRIAQGSGTSVADVNRLLKQFYEAKKLFKQIGEFEKGKHRGKIRIPFA